MRIKKSMIEHPHRDHIKDTTGIKRLWQTKLVQIIFNFCKKMGKACEHWLIKIPSQTSIYRRNARQILQNRWNQPWLLGRGAFGFVRLVRKGNRFGAVKDMHESVNQIREWELESINNELKHLKKLGIITAAEGYVPLNG